MRVLKWIVDRCHGRAGARKTEIGWLPDASAIDLAGMGADSEALYEKAQAIVPDEWRTELKAHSEFFATLQPRVPGELIEQRERLCSEFASAPAPAKQ
jgi:phosphoenolpyruvate carboxykinase (GTP)